jgi:Na+/H+ antiporter NhaD/arsenite permease-like protein
MENLGQTLPLWSVIPFLGILLSIALIPLMMPKFWHHHFGKVSLSWSLVMAVPFIIVYGKTGLYEIVHIALIDYIPFIILLWSLFTVSGGIMIKGAFAGKPSTNLGMLAVGTVLASFIGTTGAAMLMIRPILRSNQQRKHKVHIIVFCIFLVANIGGSLTPLGDPPLFLGFLHGVHFFWTMKLFPIAGVLSLFLLGIFFVMDTYYYKKEKGIHVEENVSKEPFAIAGWHNFFFLLGIIGAVLFSGIVNLGTLTVLGHIHVAIGSLVRDCVLILMGFLSIKTTSRAIRTDNGFTWGPIKEVAILFAGIFVTIIPALDILKAGLDGSLGFIIGAVKEPWQYFWVSGGLSSFLDNAPTYLTFFNTALGQFFSGMPELSGVAGLMSSKVSYLMAISAGSVFMGANSYIGNAPNFMVKFIAEENGVMMPSFFGYIFKYSLAILIPSFILITFIFFR